MIKIEHVVLPSPEQIAFVIEGMRNPKNSWDRGDSYIDYGTDDTPFIFGQKDEKLMMDLSNGGPVHRKYMRQLIVMARITAPLYWWKEFDTYRMGVERNSCSTMHKIQEKEFDWNDFSLEHLYGVSDVKLGMPVPELVTDAVINCLNFWRNEFLEKHDKDSWWQLIQLLPTSYNQTRNCMMSYEALANIYEWRKTHKLDEWVQFCQWIEELPESKIITECVTRDDIRMLEHENTKRDIIALMRKYSDKDLEDIIYLINTVV